MPLPVHKLKVPQRVVEAFGSEVELIAALNRYSKNLDGRLWDAEEMADVVVPHDTWESYRNPRGTVELWRMRSVLPLALMERTQERDGQQPGTLMIAQKETVCPFCKKPVDPGYPMVNTFAPDGTTRATHVFCANRENVPYRATAKLVEGLNWIRRQAVKDWLRERLEQLGR